MIVRQVNVVMRTVASLVVVVVEIVVAFLLVQTETVEIVSMD